MTPIEAVILGLVQGLTEFLPVSSSGHLVLFGHLLGREAPGGMAFEVAVHFATCLAIATVLRGEVFALVRAAPTLLRPARWGEAWREDEAFRMLVCVVLSSVPVGLVGVLYGDQLETVFHDLRLVGACLIATALILLVAWKLPGRERPLGLPPAMGVGLAQILAVLPGISRSGTTISAGLILGLDRAVAARFAFLMALPPIGGAAVLQLLKGAESGAPGPSATAVVLGMAMAYLSGVLALRWLLGLVGRGQLVWFAPYCAAAGITALLAA